MGEKFTNQIFKDFSCSMISEEDHRDPINTVLNCEILLLIVLRKEEALK